jgi:hypothetical protein
VHATPAHATPAHATAAHVSAAHAASHTKTDTKADPDAFHDDAWGN